MDLEINKEFVLEQDLGYLREIIFKEDNSGRRYRERIRDQINKIGVVEWFKARGLPTDEDSVWKNRYCATETKLGYELIKWNKQSNLEQEGYCLWENYLPIDIWTDKNLSKEYKQNPTLSSWCTQ